MFAGKWVELATEKIIFKPDREAVARELAAHIYDLKDKYVAQGLSGYEAEKKAVAEMGDPEDIADELARLHSPWPGFLWRLSQILLWTLVLAVVAFGISYFRYDYVAADPPPEIPEVGYTRSYDHMPGSVLTVTHRFEPEGTLRLGGYRFTCPGAWVEHFEGYTWEDGTLTPESDQMHIYLQADTWRFWEPLRAGQSMILDHAVTDSSGREYPNYLSDDNVHLYCSARTAERTATVWFEVQMTLFDGEVPDWVDIPIGYGGDVIRVDLAEEVIR